MVRHLLSFALIVTFLPETLSSKADTPQSARSEFVSLFDGKTLDGWSGDEPYWSVREGAILGQITENTLIKANRFLIYQGEIPSDFELIAEFRVSARGNSGINYRSEVVADVEFHAMRGYQCDIDGQNRYTGSNYEERRRTTLASIGESVELPESEGAADLKFVKNNRWSVRNVQEKWEDARVRAKNIAPAQWHEVRIVAQGIVLQHYIDGHLFSRVIDNDRVNRRLHGRLGIQVHTGPPMTIEYRNLRMRALP